MAEKKPSPIKLLLVRSASSGPSRLRLPDGALVKYKNSGEKFGQFSFFLSALGRRRTCSWARWGSSSQEHAVSGLPAKSFL